MLKIDPLVSAACPPQPFDSWQPPFMILQPLANSVSLLIYFPSTTFKVGFLSIAYNQELYWKDICFTYLLMFMSHEWINMSKYVSESGSMKNEETTLII